MERSRNFCFTLNNYTQEDVERVKDWECNYLIFGKEKGEEGTPHLQGYVSFKNAKTITALKKVDPRAHWEIARGSPKQAAEYCEKEGEVFEKGTRPLSNQEKGQTEKDRWSSALKAVADGRLEDVDADISGRHLKSLQYAVIQIRQSKRKLGNIEGDMEHEWIYGPTGTGKSYPFRQDNSWYIKDPMTPWWDGYTDQENVLIEDFDTYQVKQGGDMKRWLDRYPFQAPVKGGYILIRPRKIVVTSNHHPEEIWTDKLTCDCILRRVKLTHMPFKWKPALPTPPAEEAPKEPGSADVGVVGTVLGTMLATSQLDYRKKRCLEGSGAAATAELRRPQEEDEYSWWKGN